MPHVATPTLVESQATIPTAIQSPMQMLGDYDQPVGFGCDKDSPQVFFSLLELADQRFAQTEIKERGPMVWVCARAVQHQEHLQIVPIR